MSMWRVFLRNLIRDGIRPIKSTRSSCLHLARYSAFGYDDGILGLRMAENPNNHRNITCHNRLI